ncbi:hypothetical protein AB0C65_20160 [Nocardia sp. NPDC048505]|uniref:hypothetical protein n=1 Tax=Nocardia sp. NPDC048505 TaxID=3155756 RepID=UPI0033F5236B
MIDLIDRARKLWLDEYDYYVEANAPTAAMDDPTGQQWWIDERAKCRDELDALETRLMRFTQGSATALDRMFEALDEQREAMEHRREEGDLDLLTTLLSGWSGAAADAYRIGGGAEFPELHDNQIEFLRGILRALAGWRKLFTESREQAKKIAELAGDDDRSGGFKNVFLLGAAVTAAIGTLSWPPLAAASIAFLGEIASGYPPSDREPPPRNEYNIRGRRRERIERAVTAADDLLADVDREREDLLGTIRSDAANIPAEAIILGSTVPHGVLKMHDRDQVATDIASLWLAGAKVFPHLAVGFEDSNRGIHGAVDGSTWLAFDTDLLTGAGPQWTDLCTTLTDALVTSRDYLDTLSDRFLTAAADYTAAEDASRTQIEEACRALEAHWQTRDKTEQRTLDTLPAPEPPSSRVIIF